MRLTRTVAILAAPIFALAFCACAPEPTASYFHKPVAEVTQADQAAALDAWHQLVSNNPILVCIRNHESATQPDPWRTNTGNGYYGAYQYLPGTWNSAAAAVGRPDLVGILPSDVAWYDQDSVTLMYHNIVGDGPWGNRC